MSDTNGDMHFDPWEHKQVDEITPARGRAAKDAIDIMRRVANNIRTVFNQAQSHISHLEKIIGNMRSALSIKDAEVKGLRSEIRELRSKVGQNQQSQPRAATTIKEDKLPSSVPHELSVVRDFQAAVLGRNVQFTKKSIAALEKSDYRRPEDVYYALLALNYLSQMMQAKKRGDKDAAEEYEVDYVTMLEKANLRDERTGDKTKLRRFDSDYYENMGQPHEVFFERHLRRGGKHDPKATLAIYYTVRDNGTILVGGRGAEHLKNSLT